MDTAALDEVREFYTELPFNYYESATNALEHIGHNPLKAYPDLDLALADGGVETVLELGCGAGWASNSMALHYGCQVTAVDFTAAAVARAREVAGLLGTSDTIKFHCQDLYTFEPGEHFDLVFSMGVLHHTSDCRAGVQHASRFVKRDGLLYLGLYHSYGRRPFLKHYQDMVEAQGEDHAFARFQETLQHQTDTVHSKSWFRDQVLHPFETQHSFEEVHHWLKELGFDVLSTSINRFDEIGSIEDLFEQEKAFADLSLQRNIEEKTFYPGFFTIMAARS
ncbi:MAG: class I SAM-dependent methyltransferase [Pseudomonadota bacterium]